MFPTDRDMMQENTINIMDRFINNPYCLQQTVQSQGELTSNKAQERSRIIQGTLTYQIAQTTVSVYLSALLLGIHPEAAHYLSTSILTF